MKADSANQAVTQRGWRTALSKIWRRWSGGRMPDEGRASSLDPLTGLPTRRVLVEDLSDAAGQPGALALIDVDLFKGLNDRHGHAVGDAVLRQLAAVLQASLPTLGKCYRAGGDEFLVLLPGHGLDAAEQALLAWMEPLRAGAVLPAPGAEPVVVSVGLCDLAQTSDQDALRAVDVALYVAKARGRNRLVRYDDGLRSVIAARRQLAVTVAELQQQNEALHQEARTDVLTGLRNTLALHECLAQLDAAAQAAAFVFLDVDHFGQYNHVHGDGEGDRVLRQLGAVLRAQTRTGEHAYRKGGEEFVLVVPHATGDEALQLGERLRAQVEGLRIPHRGSATSTVVTITVGISLSRAGEPARDALDRAAQQAMQAKVDGRRNAVHAAPA